MHNSVVLVGISVDPAEISESMMYFRYLIVNFRDDEALGKATWSLSLQTDCNGLIGLIVECFFARRVWILSKNILLVLLIVILAFVHFGLGVVFTVEELVLGSPVGARIID
ncbi:hypothetical protein AGABI1DRAFT_128554 [Agaricus bisporus var. burnettii JB137-S8]|uniref:Uncharacterized protein n=1 Tax=Agaricus bisporus var. burnettii (strain JB137-S8 / ATCC MYA-4627 / FGSC 10392) TaxID=597362 RepID=K5X854_AGABU|nr:uncharacterized protein AGABI1DRAFT_128554 [Agaricus bisporus var. burnettii JB137-S8]EKM79403.1 hypothetical protein AGABI1DRAFT_128554 [Agaricus bisporus var. burnettii JB137-S8]